MRLTTAALGALKLDADVTDKIFFETTCRASASRARQRSADVDFSVQDWWKD